MRVISGSARGTNLIAPKGLATRPTADRTKEALFNILYNRISGSRFLDLYSGTGAVGIEALSRGAELAVFNDMSPSAVEIIKKNLEKTRLADRASIYKLKAETLVARLGLQKERFDIIFLDPPYSSGELALILTKILKSEILSTGGLIIAETAAGIDFSFPGFVAEERKYGSSKFVFLEEAIDINLSGQL